MTEYEPGTKMVFLNGSKRSFRCEKCGSNCFQKQIGVHRYRCNGCNATYEGAPSAEKST